MALWLATPADGRSVRNSSIDGLVVRAGTEEEAVDLAGEYGDSGVSWWATLIPTDGPPAVVYGAERSCWDLDPVRPDQTEGADTR